MAHPIGSRIEILPPQPAREISRQQEHAERRRDARIHHHREAPTIADADLREHHAAAERGRDLRRAGDEHSELPAANEKVVGGCLLA
jgi:hypothetical protein